MSDDSCMTCRYWMHIDNHADFPDEPLAHWGICRRYPPAVGHADESAYGFNSDTPGGWPITDGSDWCGEHGGPDDTTPKYIRHDLHDAAIEALEARAEKAEAALRELFAGCTCHPGFYERGLSDPQCPAHLYGDYARAALNEPPVCRAALAEKEGDG